MQNLLRPFRKGEDDTGISELDLEVCRNTNKNRSEYSVVQFLDMLNSDSESEDEIFLRPAKSKNITTPTTKNAVAAESNSTDPNAFTSPKPRKRSGSPPPSGHGGESANARRHSPPSSGHLKLAPNPKELLSPRSSSLAANPDDLTLDSPRNGSKQHLFLGSKLISKDGGAEPASGKVNSKHFFGEMRKLSKDGGGGGGGGDEPVSLRSKMIPLKENGEPISIKAMNEFRLTSPLRDTAVIVAEKPAQLGLELEPHMSISFSQTQLRSISTPPSGVATPTNLEFSSPNRKSMEGHALASNAAVQAADRSITNNTDHTNDSSNSSHPKPLMYIETTSEYGGSQRSAVSASSNTSQRRVQFSEKVEYDVPSKRSNSANDSEDTSLLRTGSDLLRSLAGSRKHGQTLQDGPLSPSRARDKNPDVGVEELASLSDPPRTSPPGIKLKPLIPLIPKSTGTLSRDGSGYGDPASANPNTDGAKKGFKFPPKPKIHLIPSSHGSRNGSLRKKGDEDSLHFTKGEERMLANSRMKTMM